MNEERLKYIKDRLNKFYNLVEPICQHWSKSQSHLETLIVLLQNIQYSGVECVGYSHEATVEELYKLQDIITSISKYYDSHLENWIADEVNSIINLESIHNV